MENNLYNDIAEEESQKEEERNKPTDFYMVIVIMQSVILALAILIIIGIKFVTPKEFAKMNNWYKENVMVDTTPELVLGEEALND